MKRRQFIAGLMLISAVRGAAAQQPGKVWRIAWLNPGHPGTPTLYQSWIDRMRQLGYVVGQNLIVDRRYADGDFDRLPLLIRELIALGPDVIIAFATPAVAVAQQATVDIPIIMGSVTDPVGSGFVKSLAHPGGNITGIANMSADFTPKSLELLHELLPHARRIAVLMSSNPTHPMQYRKAESAASRLSLDLVPVTAKDETDLDEAFATISHAQCDALLVLQDPFRNRIMALAAADRLPAIYQSDYFAGLGALASYGPKIETLVTMTADYADKIFKGAHPSDLPVEQPTRFLLAVNLKTAEALGVTIPPAIIARADEVIE